MCIRDSDTSGGLSCERPPERDVQISEFLRVRSAAAVRPFAVKDVDRLEKRELGNG